MSKIKPNIIAPFNDRQRFKNLVQEVINDSWIYTLTPESISLNETLFTLNLINKKFVFEDIKVDDLSDYIDVYLQGIKKPSDIYGVTEVGNNIVITFTQSIALRPRDVVKEDFVVKGKIVSR